MRVRAPVRVYGEDVRGVAPDLILPSNLDAVQCVVEVAAVWQHHFECGQELLLYLLVGRVGR